MGKLFDKGGIGLKNLLFKLYLRQQQKLTDLKTKQICDDCGSFTVPTRRLSTINLLLWVILGIAVGIGINFIFNSPGFAWMFGFITTVIATYINIKQLKPQCRKCFSHHIHPPSPEELDSQKEKLFPNAPISK